MHNWKKNRLIISCMHMTFCSTKQEAGHSVLGIVAQLRPPTKV
jgi:hypothetical protein